MRVNQAELHSREKNLQHNPVDVYSRYFRALSHQRLDERRAEGLPVSSAHSEAHLNGVGDLVPLIGQAYGFSDKEIMLGRFAGQFHDIVRSGREDLGDQDERESSDKAQSILLDLDSNGLFHTTLTERESISYAILNHGTPPAFFKDPDTRETTPADLKDRLQTMLYISDGLQKLGAPLIHRRSAFVGGERREEGDLKDMRYHGEPISAIDAILLESAVRLGWKNVEGLYPQTVRPFIEPAFAIQREWVYGLLAGNGIFIDKWVDMLWNTRNSKGQNIFELSKLGNPPKDLLEIETVLAEKGKITDVEIEDAIMHPDLMISANEAAIYFSSRYKDDSNKTIKEWNPRGEAARKWKKGM